MPSSQVSARTVTIVIVALCALIGAGAYSLGVMNMKKEVPKVEEEKATAGKKKETPFDPSVLELTPDDMIIGDKAAPVTVVEYASLSCSHCADFHTKTLPELRKTTFDKGSSKLVVRHFPLNAPALRGAQLVNCMEPTERLAFMKVLFEMQNDWAYSASFMDSLKQIAKAADMNAERFDACINDKSAEDALIAKTQEASDKLKITGTPAFFINGKPYEGPLDADAMEAAISKASKQ